ncbi:hypothetical protein TNCV_3845261 [Trichonephila clavipes]|nr:hypothetical protein TNCV_3845261 [Trichonephila clavipes]
MRKKRATSVINCPASLRPAARHRSESSIRFLEVIETPSDRERERDRECYIYFAIQSSKEAIGDGPRNFEPWSSDENENLS